MLENISDGVRLDETKIMFLASLTPPRALDDHAYGTVK